MSDDIERDQIECDPRNMDTDELAYWSQFGDRSVMKELERRQSN